MQSDLEYLKEKVKNNGSKRDGDETRSLKSHEVDQLLTGEDIVWYIKAQKN